MNTQFCPQFSLDANLILRAFVNIGGALIPITIKHYHSSDTQQARPWMLERGICYIGHTNLAITCM